MRVWTAALQGGIPSKALHEVCSCVAVHIYMYPRVFSKLKSIS